MRLVRALDRHRRVTAVPFQRSAALAAHGLTVADAEAAAWAIAPDGRRYRGAAAVNAALGTALGTGLPLRLYALPGLRQLQDRAYDWVAANRHRLEGDTPHCDQNPADCA